MVAKSNLTPFLRKLLAILDVKILLPRIKSIRISFPGIPPKSTSISSMIKNFPIRSCRCIFATTSSKAF